MAKVEAKVSLVGHGYQLDVFNHARATPDGQGVEHSMECRSFAGTYDPAEVADALRQALIDTMDKLETDYLRGKVQSQ